MLNIAQGMGESLFPQSPTGLNKKGKFDFVQNNFIVSWVVKRDMTGSAIALKHKQYFIRHYRYILFGGTIYTISLCFPTKAQTKGLLELLLAWRTSLA